MCDVWRRGSWWLPAMPMLHAILLRALLLCLRLSVVRLPVCLWITRWTCLKARLSRVGNAGSTTPWCPSKSSASMAAAWRGPVGSPSWMKLDCAALPSMAV